MTMKRSAQILSLTAAVALAAGCVHKGPAPEDETGKTQNGEEIASAIIHPTTNTPIKVANTGHRAIRAEVITIDGQPVPADEPVLVPVGVYEFKVRCTLLSATYAAKDERVFHGRTEWDLEPGKTYTVRPKYNVDEYGDPQCAASLHEAL